MAEDEVNNTEKEIIKALGKEAVKNSRSHGYEKSNAQTKRRKDLKEIFEAKFQEYYENYERTE